MIARHQAVILLGLYPRQEGPRPLWPSLTLRLSYAETLNDPTKIFALALQSTRVRTDPIFEKYLKETYTTY